MSRKGAMALRAHSELATAVKRYQTPPTFLGWLSYGLHQMVISTDGM